MTFEQKITKANENTGKPYHIFQNYGDERGYSKSFQMRESALDYANIVDGGIVYNDRGEEVLP